MKILIWDRPAQRLTKEEWKEENGHPEHPTYQPNMSEKDAQQWRAKLFTKANPPRVEIRKLCTLEGEACLKIVVRTKSEHVPRFSRNNNRERSISPRISISINGTAELRWSEYFQMLQAIAEATRTLKDLEANENSRIGTAK